MRHDGAGREDVRLEVQLVGGLPLLVGAAVDGRKRGPSSARHRTMPSPIPCPPPVTMATFPSSFLSSSYSLLMNRV
jgi:hypothetical protein